MATTAPLRSPRVAAGAGPTTVLVQPTRVGHRTQLPHIECFDGAHGKSLMLTAQPAAEGLQATRTFEDGPPDELTVGSICH